MDARAFFYVAPNGTDTRGPTSLTALGALLRAGAPDVTAATLVWTQEFNDAWRPLAEVLQGQQQQRGTHVTQPLDGVAAASSSETESSNPKHSKRGKNAGPKTSSVYVQGLPPDATEEEVAVYFAKCGILKKDAGDKAKVKLYRNEDGSLKGDGLVTYAFPDSVVLAVEQLDQVAFRPSAEQHQVLTVSVASFDSGNEPSQRSNNNNKRLHTTMVNGSSNSSSSSDAKKEERARQVRKLQERALLSWNDDAIDTKETALLIVVLKGMFAPDELRAGGAPALQLLEQDLVEGLEPICPEGNEIRKVTVFQSHPEGVILIRFKDAVSAAQCVSLMNNRFFDGRRIHASLWDGVTEYAPKEDAEVRAKDDEARMNAFAEWLEEQ